MSEEYPCAIPQGSLGSLAEPVEVDELTLKFLMPIKIIRFDQVEADGKWGKYKQTIVTVYSVASKKFYRSPFSRLTIAQFKAALEISPLHRTYGVEKGADNKLIWVLVLPS